MKLPAFFRAGDEAADDELATSRTARARAFGALGAELAATLLRAGAKRLSAEPSEPVWSNAHREGAAAMIRSLGRLRGAAAKLGQALSHTPGVLPDEYVDALVTLTDDLPAMSPRLVREQFAYELGRAPLDVFATFERDPIAAASLGQVHRATLHDGTPVAVKVQYPGIDETMRADLANLDAVIPLLETIARRDDLRAAAAEVRERLTEELDYRLEADNTELFRGIFDGGSIRIPGVYRACSTERILTLDYLEGIDIRSFIDAGPTAEERVRLTESLFRFMWVAIYEHHVLHADPNPGNYLVCDDGKLGVVDFGCVKSLSPAFVKRMRGLLGVAAAGTDAQLDDELVAAEILDPTARPEHRAVVRTLIRLWAAPGSSPDFDYGDRAYVDELVRMQQVVVRDGAMKLDPAWVFLGRGFVGLTHLLHKLAARADFRALFAEFFRPAR